VVAALLDLDSAERMVTVDDIVSRRELAHSTQERR